MSLPLQQVFVRLGFGFNSLALSNQGLSEMTRLAACGGKRDTLGGWRGWATPADLHREPSRNRSVGVQLGQGRKLAEIVSSTRMVAEGVLATTVALALARKHQWKCRSLSNGCGATSRGSPKKQFGS
jgi:glycerol-3-phosphate dehydrogenase (NAD(P)+)